METLTGNQTVDILDKLTENMYRYGVIPVCIMGVLGHILNILLFTRPSFLNSSCCNYFLASSCVALFQIAFSQPFAFLTNGLGIPLTNVWLCRVRFYISHSAYMASSFLITFASADRFASSCRQVKHRRWADVGLARKIIPVVLVIAFAINVHVLTSFIINSKYQYECWAAHGTTYRFIFDIILLAYVVVYPLMIGLFGVLTIYNIRRCIHRKSKVHSLNCCLRDSQRMTLVQIVCIIILTLPYAVLKLHRTIMTPRYGDKSDLYWAVERFIKCGVDFGCFINDGSGFYIYSLSSKTFRRALFQLIDEYRSKLFRCYQPQEAINLQVDSSDKIVTEQKDIYCDYEEKTTRF